MGRYIKSALLSASLLASTALAANAANETIYALTGDKTIVRIDADTAQVQGSVDVIANGPRIAGIDVRPADGQLYALFTNGRVAVVNPQTGQSTLRSTINFDFTDASYSIDFNPVVDRLRIVGSNDKNLRANVDTGSLTVDADLTGPSPNPFDDPNVIVLEVAYTNSFAGAVATQLYDIDRFPAALYLQVPPNSGNLSAVGMINMPVNDVGFDISVDEQKRNRGWLVTRRWLAEIDLAGGAVLSRRTVEGLSTVVRDIAVSP